MSYDFDKYPSVPNAIKNLLPDIVEDVDFQYRDDADGKGAVLHWLNKDVSKPSQNEIDAELKKLQDKYDANEYQRQREADYPSFAEQFDLLYHKGISGLKAELKKTKDKFPKP
tara:strand:+ start:2349 stop:2687 length:339 start_codon:yes stop_codon:yes gene_type:complete